jgi:hypothetical protein
VLVKRCSIFTFTFFLVARSLGLRDNNELWPFPQFAVGTVLITLWVPQNENASTLIPSQFFMYHLSCSCFFPVLFSGVALSSHVSTHLTTTTTNFLYICIVIIILENAQCVGLKIFSKNSVIRKKYWPFSKTSGIVLPSNPEASAIVVTYSGVL